MAMICWLLVPGSLIKSRIIPAIAGPTRVEVAVASDLLPRGNLVRRSAGGPTFGHAIRFSAYSS